MVLIEIGEESIFIGQIGGAFRIHSLRVYGGTCRSFLRCPFSRGRRRSVYRGVRAFSSGRYEDSLLIATRWNFDVNRLVIIPLGVQEAIERVGDLVYEARAVFNGEVELGQSWSPTHKAACRVRNRHQPAEGVMVSPFGEPQSLDPRSQRRYAPYNGVSFAFGSRIVPFSVG